MAQTLLVRLSPLSTGTCSAAACFARAASRLAPAKRSSAPRAASASRSVSSAVGVTVLCSTYRNGF